MLEVIKYEGLKNGKNLLILVAIHGNEVCGPKAITNIIKKIKNNEIKIKTGSVTFIPICNLEAYKQNKRYININLNRIFEKIENPKNNEEIISQKIIKYIDECDYLLDIHSIHSEGPSFAFLDKDTEEEMKKFVIIQNFQSIIVGWNDIFGKNDKSTCGYALKYNKICTTIECGNHNDPLCIERAETAIKNSLAFLDIADCELSFDKNNQKFIKMEKVFYKEKEGYFVKNWKHLDTIKSEEIIAKYNDGEVIKAKKDCLIIMPHEDNPIGTEWFYLGKYIN